MPIDLTVTSGTVADSSQADKLISDIEAQYLLADRGYDTNKVLELVASKGMEAVIPPKRNRRKKREYNEEVYENRYQVEKLERYSDPICKKHIIIYSRGTNMLYVSVATYPLTTHSTEVRLSGYYQYRSITTIKVMPVFED